MAGASSDANIIRTLRERCDYLEEENRQLKDQLKSQLNGASPGDVFTIPGCLHMTPTERRCWALLLRHDTVVSKDAIAECFGGKDAQRPIEMVAIYICRIRGKLAPFDIRIETRWGVGYYVDAASREAWRALCEREGANR